MSGIWGPYQGPGRGFWNMAKQMPEGEQIDGGPGFMPGRGPINPPMDGGGVPPVEGGYGPPSMSPAPISGPSPVLRPLPAPMPPTMPSAPGFQSGMKPPKKRGGMPSPSPMPPAYPSMGAGKPPKGGGFGGM